MLAFLVSPLVKYGSIALIVLAILFGVFEWGHSKGHDAGYQDAWSVQQKTINSMVDRENAQAQANNKKIADIESDSFAASFQNKATQAKLETARTQVVTKYVQANPQTSSTCGFDLPMVQAINSVLQADPVRTASGDSK